MKIIISGVLATFVAMGMFGTTTQKVPESVVVTKYERVQPPDQSLVIAPSKWIKLSHEQEVYLHALEWCESRGVKTAINPFDSDGTPSYYSFQFKPATFKNFGIKYGLLKSDISDDEIFERIKDYDLQKEIVTNMILDFDVRFSQQFPACTRQFGEPPRLVR